MKRKTVWIAVLLVLVLASGCGLWQEYSGGNAVDGQTPSASERETVSEISESTTETSAAQEPASVQENTEENNLAADDVPEGDADARAEDPDVPAGDSSVNTAPDFTVLDMDGQEVRLSDLFGQRILINFWATWCPPCRAELPYFEEAYQEYGEDIVFLMVDLTDGSRETVDGVKAFAAEYGYSFPVYYDTEYSAVYAYGIDAIPQTYAIGPDGNVLMSQVGSMSESRLKEFTDALLENAE